MLSFNCADLIFVTYLVTENTVYHTNQSSRIFSGLVEAHKCTLCVWICGFPSYIVSRLSDSTLHQRTTSEELNVCVEEGWYNNKQHTGLCVTQEGGVPGNRLRRNKKTQKKQMKHTSLIFSLQSLYCFFWLSRKVVSSFFCWAMICCWNFFSSANTVFIWGRH